MPPRASQNSATAEPFPISGLPNEVQTAIYTEALNKPHVHFMLARRNKTVPWTLKFNAKPKAQDHSGFRLRTVVSQVSHIAARAARIATIEKVRLPFTRGTQVVGNIDALTDIVCVEFENVKDWRNVRFARHHQIPPQRFQREEAVAMLTGIRKVGITIQDRPSVFRCLYQHQHSNCRLCPEELVGLLDCFPDLESVYIIVRWNPRLDGILKHFIHTYRDRVFSLSQGERKAKGIEIFHTRKNSFIEVHSQFVEISRMPTGWRVPTLLDGLRTAFNRQNAQYTMSPEKRQNLKFKFLVETDRN